MPYGWVDPAILTTLPNGMSVYRAYKDDNIERPLEWSFVLRDADDEQSHISIIDWDGFVSFHSENPKSELVDYVLAAFNAGDIYADEDGLHCKWAEDE